MAIILHITTRADWDAVADLRYEPNRSMGRFATFHDPEGNEISEDTVGRYHLCMGSDQSRDKIRGFIVLR